VKKLRESPTIPINACHIAQPDCEWLTGGIVHILDKSGLAFKFVLMVTGIGGSCAAAGRVPRTAASRIRLKAMSRIFWLCFILALAAVRESAKLRSFDIGQITPQNLRKLERSAIQGRDTATLLRMAAEARPEEDRIFLALLAQRSVGSHSWMLTT